MTETAQPYDSWGARYSTTRHSDPSIARRVVQALGDARTVLNVGAGTGSYEPTDRWLVAVEPSAVMLAQRAVGAAPAIRASPNAYHFGRVPSTLQWRFSRSITGPTYAKG